MLIRPRDSPYLFVPMNLTMNPLPPQAYTRDTLLKALRWVLSQPDHIKEMANSEDLAVSLYLKAQRQGEESLERPSIQNFKNELKSLAGMMGELEGQKQPVTSLQNSMMQQNSVQNHPPLNHQQNHPQQSQNISASQFQAPRELDLKSVLDVKSWSMIQEVKTAFNLSSETEVLRLLISLGYHKSKQIMNP